jgi:hypothetical protein
VFPSFFILFLTLSPLHCHIFNDVSFIIIIIIIITWSVPTKINPEVVNLLSDWGSANQKAFAILTKHSKLRAIAHAPSGISTRSPKCEVPTARY